MIFQSGTQAILIIYLNIDIRCHTNYRNVCPFFYHGNSWLKNGLVTTKFINDQTLDAISLIFIQQVHSSNQLRKHTSTINITNKKKDDADAQVRVYRSAQPEVIQASKEKIYLLDKELQTYFDKKKLLESHFENGLEKLLQTRSDSELAK